MTALLFHDSDACDSMADPAASSYSKSAVVGAGKSIRERLPEGDIATEAYRVANSWRDSHVHPMRRVRSELTVLARRIMQGSARGLSVARLKRMQSVKAKLRKSGLTLYQMQDIAGCRIILPDIRHVDLLLDVYRDGNTQRSIVRHNDYIETPKLDGYRCQHLIFKFDGPEDNESYARHFIEVQLRSRLQHAWATAVEAVGLFRNEDFKGGGGDPEWRRFFVLVSSYFAEQEGTAIVPGTVVDADDRRVELQALIRQLDALKELDGIREAIQFSESVYSPEAKFFLIQYDYAARKVYITPQAYLKAGLESYYSEEAQHAGVNSVLVEADRLDDLKAAYPNYFLDVGIFTEELRNIVRYTAPRKLSHSGWIPNLNWLKDWRKRD